MNILFIKHFFVGFMVSEIPRVSVFGYFPLHDIIYNYIMSYNTIILLENANNGKIENLVEMKEKEMSLKKTIYSSLSVELTS